MSADELSFDKIEDPRERACIEALEHAGFRWADLSLYEVRRFIVMYDAMGDFEATDFGKLLESLEPKKGS